MTRVAIGAALLLAASACGFDVARADRRSAAEAFDPGRDDFPEKARFEFATQLTVEYHTHYKVVVFRSNSVAEETQFLLLQRGTPRPVGYPDAIVLPVPLERFAMGSYRYGGVINLLGVTDRVVAFGNARHVTTPGLKALLDRGAISEHFTAEIAANRDAEVIMNYYANGRLMKDQDVFTAVGVPLVPMAEHLEPTPLAKAEWIKFFAMFFNLEGPATAYFDQVAARYRSLAARAAQTTTRPVVFSGTPGRDGWSTFGAGNAFARLIEDAGGVYGWSDLRSRNSLIDASFERALEHGERGDVWTIHSDLAGPRGLDRAILTDDRFSAFPSIRDHRVFLCLKPWPGDRNPYWDQALIHPDLELRDHVAMLHPEIVGPDELTYYRRLELPRE